MNDSQSADKPLEVGLFLLRVTTGLFLLVWSVDKILNPGHAQRVFDKFYFLEITPTISTGLGVAQTLVILAFMAGIKKFWTYGAILAMHTVSVASTWERLIDPYGGGNLLFWAAVPLWAALLLLWLARDRDRMLSFG